MSNFHDDSIKFMTDIIQVLTESSESGRLGTDTTGEETLISSLLRLIGVTSNVTLQINDNSSSQVQAQSTETIQDLFNNYFKTQTGLRSNELSELNVLLKGFRKRLTRYSKIRQKIKLNRTKTLIDLPTNPVDSDKIVKNTIDQTLKEIVKVQQKIRKEGDLKGIIDQDIELQTTMEKTINSSIKIPPEIGGFRNQLVRFLSANAKAASDNVEMLYRKKTEVQNEVNRLENAEKLLFSGVEISGQKLSLLKILDLLIFLTDKKKFHYNCSECKYFRSGKTNVCIFAGKGSVSLTQIVNFKDSKTGETVVGRLTEQKNSCKQIWGLDSNEYFTPSESVIQSIEKILED